MANTDNKQQGKQSWIFPDIIILRFSPQFPNANVSSRCGELVGPMCTGRHTNMRRMMVLCTLSTVVKDAGGFWFILKRCDGRWMGHWGKLCGWMEQARLRKGRGESSLKPGPCTGGILTQVNPRAAAGAAV